MITGLNNNLNVNRQQNSGFNSAQNQDKKANNSIFNKTGNVLSGFNSLKSTISGLQSNNATERAQAYAKIITAIFAG